MKTAGRRCKDPVSLLDLYPTLTELCDIEVPNSLDGKSLKPYLFNPDLESGRVILTLFDPGNITFRSNRWRYIRYADGSEELYDMIEDPQEWNNLANHTQHLGVLEFFRGRIPPEALGLSAETQPEGPRDLDHEP
jgi:iduronate 2-sulfatase